MGALGNCYGFDEKFRIATLKSNSRPKVCCGIMVKPCPRLRPSLRKEMGLADLVMAQVLCIVGSSWVDIAAKLGRTHVAY